MIRRPSIYRARDINSTLTHTQLTRKASCDQEGKPKSGVLLLKGSEKPRCWGLRLVSALQRKWRHTYDGREAKITWDEYSHPRCRIRHVSTARVAKRLRDTKILQRAIESVISEGRGLHIQTTFEQQVRYTIACPKCWQACSYGKMSIRIDEIQDLGVYMRMPCHGDIYRKACFEKQLGKFFVLRIHTYVLLVARLQSTTPKILRHAPCVHSR